MKRQNYSKLFLLTLIFTLLFTSISLAEIGVYLEDEKINMPISPVLEDGRTLVPMRAIFEEVGADVEWDKFTKTVTATKDNISIKLPIGSKKAHVNGKIVDLDVAARTVNGSTLVPVRFVTETLGFETGWDNSTHSVLLNSNAPFGEYKVKRIIDGTTMEVVFNGQEESLKLIGVDTKVSSGKSDAGINEKIASDYAKKVLEGKSIGIEFDIEERDKDGNLLGYVYNNGEMFNKILLEKAYAKTTDISKNNKYKDDFMKIEQGARKNKRGVWTPKELTSTKPQVKSSPKNKEETKMKVKPSVPKVGAYIGSIKSDKYHKPTCRYAKKIKYANKIGFKNKTDARNKSYVPCKVCKP